MLKVGLLCGVIAAMSASGISFTNSPKAPSKVCDTKFIVELEQGLDKLSNEQVIKSHDAMVKRICKKVNASAKKVLSYSVLNNAFVVTGSKEDKDAISSLSGVKSVTEDVGHVMEKSSGQGFTFKVNKAVTFDENENASAITMQKPNDTNDGEGTVIAILDNEFYFKGKVSGDSATPFHHEVFDELPSGVKQKFSFDTVKNAAKKAGFHAVQSNSSRGYEGSLYFNTKVPFYYDYAGDSETGNSEDLPMDHDVSSNIGLHGSHVASIAAANATLTTSDSDNPGATEYKGIAPKAQLACMKVFSDIKNTPAGEAVSPGNYSRFSESGFLAALEDCILLGVDAINVSIGSDLDDFDLGSITQKTLEKLTDEGILSAISAGNGGKSSYAFAGGYGNWTRDVVETGVLGSFANNGKTMSVASGQPDWTYYENAFKIGTENVAFEDQIVNREGQPKEYDVEYKISDLVPASDGTLGYVYVPGFGASSDYNGLNVTGKIAVVNRGSLDFSTKYANAVKKGAIALIIINNDPTASDFNFRCSFGEGFRPTMPCALVLFKDKPLFVNQPEGRFTIIHKEVDDNKLKRTISDFSSDGARFDLDLKPEITTPGSNIRGAVWPQNKDEKETPYAAYEYLNGTSMAAPNYAGAMSVVVSKVAKDKIADGKITAEEEAEIKAYRQTVNMRMMSTAVPMSDFEVNGEDGRKSLTSPRIQGAGMVNIDGAYHTEVYLKGSDVDGTVLDKSKILLRNGEDIAKGDINLSFTAVNEGTSSHSYKAKVVVMRPATIEDNEIVSKEYNYGGEVSDIGLIPGLNYAVLRSGVYVMKQNDDTAKFKDVIKISREIEYYTSPEDAQNETNVKKFSNGYYYWSENKKWEPLPNSTYQSVKDKVLTEVDAGTLTFAPGEQLVNLEKISLTEAQKDEIAKLYPYGTYIEGYVKLEAVSNEDPSLSIPYLGFYSLTDKDSKNSFDTAPVVEPFSFEKDKTQIYASDLVNDICKSLLGKDLANFESMWVVGHTDKLSDLNTEKVLSNDQNFANITGFRSVGTIPDPFESKFTDTPSEDIYVGNAHSSNTMVIQQFVLRSVKDNYFTITNKATNEVVYKDVLEDMLFGEQQYKYPLYKSHVDSDYLGAGYVAHRAYAVVPLYDPLTREAFASGDYEIKFNYQLATSGNWVSKSYTMHIDSEAPEIGDIVPFKDGDKDMVRITFKDMRVAYAIVGSIQHEVKKGDDGNYYVEVEKSEITRAMNEIGDTSFSKKRLYVAAVDYANGRTGAIVHFNNSDYSDYTMLQGYGLSINNDFKYENETLSLISVDEYYNEHEYKLEDGAKLVDKSGSTVVEPEKEEKVGFFAKIRNFFASLFDSIKKLFKK